MKSKQIELSIIMPCLNEEETIGVCIDKANLFLQKHNINGEIIIGDNGSSDSSIQIAKDKDVIVVNVKKKGYGSALYHATLRASGKYIIMGDSDDSYDFYNLMPFLSKLREGYDLVMGNRFKGGIKPGAMPWKNRLIGNPILSFIGRLFFKTEIRDFHCGLRGFKKAAFLKMDLKAMGMEYASEMVVKSTLLGLRVTEVPTILSPDGRSRPPHLRPWRDAWRHVRFMLLYSPRWLFLYPGLFLLFLGSVIIIWLTGGPIFIGDIAFSVHTMIYAACFILIGFQSISTAIFSKIYTSRVGLLPQDTRVESLTNFFKLEYGIALGLLLISFGGFGSFKALSIWKELNYGKILGIDVLKIVIVSVLSIFLGIQVLLNSFFLSVLDLNLRGKD